MAGFDDPAYSPLTPATLLRQSLLDQQAMRVQNTELDDALKTALRNRALLAAQAGFTNAGTRQRQVETEGMADTNQRSRDLYGAAGGLGEFAGMSPAEIQGLSQTARVGRERALAAPFGVDRGLTMGDVVTGTLSNPALSPTNLDLMGLDTLLVGNDLAVGATQGANLADARAARAQQQEQYLGTTASQLFALAGPLQGDVRAAIEAGDIPRAVGLITNEPTTRYNAAATMLNAMTGVMSSRASVAAAAAAGKSAALDASIEAKKRSIELFAEATKLGEKLPDRKDDYEDILKRARAWDNRASQQYAEATGVPLPTIPENMSEPGQVADYLLDAFNFDFGALYSGLENGPPSAAAGRVGVSASGSTSVRAAGVDPASLPRRDSAAVNAFNDDGTLNLDAEMPDFYDPQAEAPDEGINLNPVTRTQLAQRRAQAQANAEAVASLDDVFVNEVVPIVGYTPQQVEEIMAMPAEARAVLIQTIVSQSPYAQEIGAAYRARKRGPLGINFRATETVTP